MDKKSKATEEFMNSIINGKSFTFTDKILKTKDKDVIDFIKDHSFFNNK